jgi:hypothetical protein
VTGHCGGAGPLQNGRKDHRQFTCRSCRSIGHFLEFYPHRPEGENGNMSVCYSGRITLRREHVCWELRRVARQQHDRRVAATAMTSSNNRRTAGSGASMRANARQTAAQQWNTPRRQERTIGGGVFCWIRPEGYITRSNSSFLSIELRVGLQAHSLEPAVSECSSPAARERGPEP